MFRSREKDQKSEVAERKRPFVGQGKGRQEEGQRSAIVRKKEWDQEKYALLDEISSLKTRLDSQIRITRDLQNRLQMCKQALAHEETRRKYLEVEISRFKACFENIFAECQVAKSQLDCLNSQRDNEVATLRHLLGINESFYKEMEY